MWMPAFHGVNKERGPDGALTPFSVVACLRRSTLTRARQMADVFPKDVNVAWEGLPQGYAPRVADVIDLVVRLEDRLKTGEKVTMTFRPTG